MAYEVSSEDCKKGPFTALGDPGPAFEAIAFRLSSIGFAISEHFRSSLEPFGIEPRQFALLRAVGFLSGKSQRELAEQLKVPTSSMVAAIDDLQRRNLIERRASSKDRRVKALHLTQKGQKLMDQLLPIAMRTELMVREALGPDDSAVLEVLLGKVGPKFGVVPGSAHSAMTKTSDEPNTHDETDEPTK